MTCNIGSGAIRWQIPDFLSDDNGNYCIFQRLLIKMASHLKSLTLKMYFKVMHCNIRNGPIRWQISTSIEIILAQFFANSPFLRNSHFEILTLKIRDLENVGQGHDVQQHTAMATFDRKCPTSYLLAIVIFDLSLTVYETFANLENANA